MAPRTRMQRSVAAKEVAGPSHKTVIPRRKLIIRDSSDETSSEDNVSLIRRKNRLIKQAPAIDLNMAPVAQGDAQTSLEEERNRQEQLAVGLDEEMQASSEEERVKEKERKKEEERKINEEINRWAIEFEKEFEIEEREEQEALGQAQAMEGPREVPAGTEVEELVETEEALPTGGSRTMLEASSTPLARAPRVCAASVPAALRLPKKKRPAEREPSKRAEPSKKKGKKPVVEEEEVWMEEWMVSPVAATRYEYIGYKDFEQEQRFSALGARGFY